MSEKCVENPRNRLVIWSKENSDVDFGLLFPEINSSVSNNL